MTCNFTSLFSSQRSNGTGQILLHRRKRKSSATRSHSYGLQTQQSSKKILKSSSAEKQVTSQQKNQIF